MAKLTYSLKDGSKLVEVTGQGRDGREIVFTHFDANGKKIGDYRAFGAGKSATNFVVTKGGAQAHNVVDSATVDPEIRDAIFKSVEQRHDEIKKAGLTEAELKAIRVNKSELNYGGDDDPRRNEVLALRQARTTALRKLQAVSPEAAHYLTSYNTTYENNKSGFGKTFKKLASIPEKVLNKAKDVSKDAIKAPEKAVRKLGSKAEDLVRDVGSKIDDKIIQPGAEAIKDAGRNFDDKLLHPVVKLVEDAAKDYVKVATYGQVDLDNKKGGGGSNGETNKQPDQQLPDELLRRLSELLLPQLQGIGAKSLQESGVAIRQDVEQKQSQEDTKLKDVLGEEKVHEQDKTLGELGRLLLAQLRAQNKEVFSNEQQKTFQSLSAKSTKAEDEAEEERKRRRKLATVTNKTKKTLG